MKNLKKFLVLLIVSDLFCACKDHTNQNLVETATANDYVNYEIPKQFQENTATMKVPPPAFQSCSVNEPRRLSTLNSGSRKFVFLIDKNNQSTGSLFGLVNLSLNDDEKEAIVDFMQYKDTICTPGSGGQTGITTRLAAGVRLFLKIKTIRRNLSLNIPTKVAAASEFGFAQTTFQIETIGFANNQTRQILSDLGQDFNVESYVKIVGAVGDIMKIMKDSLIVNPAQIPILNN